MISLNRRHFGSGLLGSAFLFGGTSLALGAGTVSVAQFGAVGNGVRDDTLAFENAIRSGASTIVVPTGMRCRIGRTLLFNNVQLVLDGGLLLFANLRFSGNTSVVGTGTVESPNAAECIFDLPGTFLVQGVRFVNCFGVAAVRVSPPVGVTIASFTARNCSFTNCNYGILRQGQNAFGSVTQSVVTGCTFDNLRGDAIEFNMITRDGSILVENNVISNIRNLQARPNWGIAIGFAGSAYTNTFDDATSVKNFIVRGNRITNVCQGIHVESGKDFLIENNVIDTIAPENAPNSGLVPIGIVAYGSNRFSIQGNTVTNNRGVAAISIEPGVAQSRYVAIPQVYTVAKNTAQGRGTIVSYSKGAAAALIINDNNADALRHFGLVASLEFCRNKVPTTGTGFGMEVNLRPTSGPATFTGEATRPLVRYQSNFIGTREYVPTGWKNDQITKVPSGGTTPTNPSPSPSPTPSRPAKPPKTRK